MKKFSTFKTLLEDLDQLDYGGPKTDHAFALSLLSF